VFLAVQKKFKKVGLTSNFVPDCQTVQKV